MEHNRRSTDFSSHDGATTRTESYRSAFKVRDEHDAEMTDICIAAHKALSWKNGRATFTLS